MIMRPGSLENLCFNKVFEEEVGMILLGVIALVMCFLVYAYIFVSTHLLNHSMSKETASKHIHYDVTQY